MREMWNHPLGRHILVILMLKLLIIFGIWWLFFRPLEQSSPRDAAQVGAALLGAHAVSTPGQSLHLPTASKEP